MRLFWTVCCIFTTIQVVRCQPQSVGNKTSSFLKQTFSTYNKDVRPYFGDKPVQVSVSGYVLDIHDISDINQEFTVSMYLRHEWKDPRLEFTEAEAGTDKIILSKEYADKIWLVDTFVVNERESKAHDLVTANAFTSIAADGTVLISSRYSIKASCRMDLKWFPFDRHTCPLVIESYGHTTADLIYNWKVDDKGESKTAVGVSKETSSIQFTVAGVNARMEEETVNNKTYSRHSVEFFLIRASNRYVHEVYLPATLLTCMSFITLLYGTGTLKTRLHLSIYIEGMLIILMALSAKTMPPVSYQTALDFYLVVCLLIVSVVVTANATNCVMLRSDNDDEKEDSFDIRAQPSGRTGRVVRLLAKLRLGIPFGFMVFNLLYWMIVLIGSSFFPEDFLILENWRV